MTTEQSAPPQQAAVEKHTWPRDHPIFIAITAFLAGLAYTCLVPAAYVGLTRVAFDQDTADRLFPLLAILLALPLALLVPARTRWFARHFLLGMFVTSIVIVGVSALVLWLMMAREG